MKKKNIDYTSWSNEELIKEIKRIKETTYGLVWHRDVPQEKIDVLVNPDARTPEEMFVNEVAGKPFPVLKEVKSKEVVSDKKDQTHILIEGDNYHSLAVLNFTHQETIDVIYIDPPYNTGNNDFIYTDNFKSGYVDKEDPFRHSKWLSFIEKRLKLSQKLLKSTGVILISIDDNEQAPLKMLCDEIFGENNFIATLVWKKKYTGGKHARHYVDMHEYILVYAKDKSQMGEVLINRPESEKGKFTKKDEYFKTRGKYYTRPLKSNLAERKTLVYPIKTPDGKMITTQWIVSEPTYFQMLRDGRIEFSKKRDGSYQVSKKYYEKDSGGQIKVPSLILDFPNTEAKVELKNIFQVTEGRDNVFYTVKPKNLIKYLIRPFVKKDSLILDFMAGSGTTGHALLDLNKEDGGNRKFILCTNNENKIATDICQPRLQKVMKGYKNNKGEKVEGLGGNLKYFTAYDFVESEPSDKNKHKLVNKCTEMLCIKEGIYDPVIETNDYKILKSHDDRYLGIIFYEDAIDEYKKTIKKIDAPINTYVFSLGDDPHTAQFADVADKVALQAIPEIILKVYQEIFR